MITVGVSGINAIDNPGPGTSVARCLRESGLECRIVGLAYDAMEPGIYMDWLIDKAYILPYPSGDPEHFLDRLRQIHAREKLDAIVPSLDVELPVYARLEQELSKLGIRLMIPTREAFKARSKEHLDSLAATIGLRSPTTVKIAEEQVADGALRGLDYPVFVKGAFYDAIRSETPEEARRAVREISNRWGFPVLAQEAVAGDEYNLAGLGDGKGGLLGMVGVKKMMVTRLGKIWVTVSIRNERLFDAARRFAAHLCWRGGFELELVRHRQSGEPYLIEVNPRFPAWIYMAKGCGINLPERMVRTMMGLECARGSDYEPGKVMIRYTAEMIRSIGDIEKLTMEGES